MHVFDSWLKAVLDACSALPIHPLRLGIEKMVARAPITPLRPNVDKIVASISYLVRTASASGLQITQYDIVKSLFLADKAHLNKYGRPITFDNYSAMKDGPVPSLSYNFLKRDQFCMKRLGIKDFPWSSEAAPRISENAEVFSPKEGVSTKEDSLSESDIEELQVALLKVEQLGFKQVRKLTHDDPAYLEAWQENADVRSFPMSLSLLFEKANEEEARNIEFLSKHS